MPSLGETYDRRAGVASRRQVVVGTGVFLSGALLVVGAILAGATGLLLERGFTVYQGREIAGILAGLGLPAVFVGITTVLPATRLHRAAAVVGSGLAVFGVMLFRYAYPEHWYSAPGVPTSMVFFLTVVYFLGVLITFWSLFTAVATFKTRNDPGGTVDLRVDPGGAAKAVKVVQEEVQNAGRALSGLGGIGTFGGVEDTSKDLGPTPTANASVSDGGQSADADIVEATAGGGGVDTSVEREDGAVVMDAEVDVEPDRYCGNCEHFDYTREGTGMQPYCGLYEEPMDDMEACNWWSKNT
ncbi:MAG: hypothetical protein ABEI31_08380 [Halodesulfurarchaeum sp.]